MTPQQFFALCVLALILRTPSSLGDFMSYENNTAQVAELSCQMKSPDQRLCGTRAHAAR
jgi:hypothetical protein